MNESSEFENLTRDSNGFIRLTRSYSDLFKKTAYTTKIPVVINRIIEYDLKSANISALRYSGKISSDILNMLSRTDIMDKKTREVKVGMMIREDSEFGKIIKKGIKNAREMLFRANHIQDDEVISIKNDAVFIAGRKLKVVDFEPFHFVRKNTYSLYMKLSGFEFYYDGRNNVTHIKGLGGIENEEDHQKGMMIFFNMVFKLMIQGRRKDLTKYLINFSNSYKEKSLPVQYYKELRSPSMYRTTFDIGDYFYEAKYASEHDLDIINGVYNYNRFILPIIQMFI